MFCNRACVHVQPYVKSAGNAHKNAKLGKKKRILQSHYLLKKKITASGNSGFKLFLGQQGSSRIAKVKAALGGFQAKTLQLKGVTTITHLFHRYSVCSISISGAISPPSPRYRFLRNLGTRVQVFVPDVSIEFKQACLRTT